MGAFGPPSARGAHLAAGDRLQLVDEVERFAGVDSGHRTVLGELPPDP
jgi:hypothetical protein